MTVPSIAIAPATPMDVRVAPLHAIHNDAPASMNPTAVSRTMRGQPGTMLVSCSMSSDQPASTNTPTMSVTNAANRARLRPGSALSEIPMAGKLIQCLRRRNLVRLSLESPNP